MELIQATYAEINLDNLIFNFEQIKEDNKDKKICCVVKANAYGHGHTMVTRELEANGADYFATSSLQEALALRFNGIKKPILILTALLPGTDHLAIENDIETTVYTYDQARLLDLEAAKLDKIHNIHIKVDTGMNRIGFETDRWALEDIEKISKLKNIHLKGIFTHFAQADAKSEYNLWQKDNFYKFIADLEARGIGFDLIHMDNSAASMIQHNKGDMIRFGIGLYGLYPSEFVDIKSDIKLKPVMSLYTHVTHVKLVNKGESISYSRTFIAAEDMKVATLGIGYGDGLPRILSNRAFVVIAGKKCRIVGNICMDQLMVDVSSLDVRPGDIAEIFGESQSVNSLAVLANTISYEILTSVAYRVPRIYTRSGKRVYESWPMMREVK